MPSRQRAWLASTWPKGVSATAISSAVMPTPVSRTLTSTPLRCSSRDDVHRAAAARELERVGDEVGEDLAQAHAVAADRRQVGLDALLEQHAGFSAISRNEEAEALSTSSRSTSRGSIDGFAALDLRDVEDVVDDGEQVAGGVVDEVGVVDDLVGRQLPLVLLGEQLGEADDGVERRAQLMAHVGDELGLHLAGELGLDARRVLGNARAMTKYGVAQKRSVLAHQGRRLLVGEGAAEHR